jgi:hypothetical protein
MQVNLHLVALSANAHEADCTADMESDSYAVAI